MDDAEKEWVQNIAEMLSDLQAARIAQSTLLEALIISHPNPTGLREVWDRLAAPRIAAAAQSQALSDHARRVDADLLHYLHNWTAKLDRYHPR